MKKLAKKFLYLLVAFLIFLPSNGLAYEAIDIGAAATDYDSSYIGGNTNIDVTNPANATGVLTSFELWFNTAGTNVKAGTFSGSSTTYSYRDHESIGNVTSGSKQTFTGKNCDVTTGDFLGIIFSGNLEYNSSGGSGIYYAIGDKFSPGANSYGLYANLKQALYATGYTIPDAPTSVSATDNLTDKVTVTWTKPSAQNVTGYRVYRDGGDVSGLLGDVATYNDTTGTADVTYAYTVKAINLAGLSAASSADNGTKISAGVTFIPQVIIIQ